MNYFLVALGSALGGVLRYVMTRPALIRTDPFPSETVLVNILGAFVIGFFGTLTLSSGRLAVSESTRLFVMVGVCGGFTTFSSFSLQTFDLARSGAWGKALLNVVLSVVLCFLAVGAGHLLAQRLVTRGAKAA